MYLFCISYKKLLPLLKFQPSYIEYKFCPLSHIVYLISGSKQGELCFALSTGEETARFPMNRSTKALHQPPGYIVEKRGDSEDDHLHPFSENGKSRSENFHTILSSTVGFSKHSLS